MRCSQQQRNTAVWERMNAMKGAKSGEDKTVEILATLLNGAAETINRDDSYPSGPNAMHCLRTIARIACEMARDMEDDHDPKTKETDNPDTGRRGLTARFAAALDVDTRRRARS